MNNQQIMEFLSEFISIQSVSTDPNRFSQALNAAVFLQKKLESLGFTTTIIHSSPKQSTPPLLVASKIISSSAKTIGIYGHYDVQPEDPIAEWKSEPFRLTARDGKLFGRGVADNKGHVVQNIAAIESLIVEKKLQRNIVFVLEGEEETGSVHLERCIQKAHEIIKQADTFYVIDTGMHKKDHPQIFYALRGLVYFELTVRIGQKDLHSGVYGNRVLNPIQVLTDLFSKIKSIETGRVLIPDFYKDVRHIPQEEMKLLQQIIRPAEEELKEAGVYRITSIDSIPPSLVSKILPSCDAHGIIGGYTGPGSKTVIPRQARIKFSFRLVENQDPENIEKRVASFIKKNLPEGVRYDLQTHSKAAPFYTDIHNDTVKKTADILQDTFKNPVIFNRSGGSIPAAEVFQRLYHQPVILTGFTLPDDNIHSPNENFDEEMFWKGIISLKKLYSA